MFQLNSVALLCHCCHCFSQMSSVALHFGFFFLFNLLKLKEYMTKISTKQFTERLKEEGAGNVTISINKIQQYLSNGEGARAEKKHTHTICKIITCVRGERGRAELVTSFREPLERRKKPQQPAEGTLCTINRLHLLDVCHSPNKINFICNFKMACTSGARV